MLPTDSLLDQRQCAAFTAVAAGSFEKAAQQLFDTPSAVSLRVQALEKQLGVLLIERTPVSTPRSRQHLIAVFA